MDLHSSRKDINNLNSATPELASQDELYYAKHFKMLLVSYEILLIVDGWILIKIALVIFNFFKLVSACIIFVLLTKIYLKSEEGRVIFL